VTLRITREPRTAARAILRLEGNLVREWVNLLELECSELRRSAGAVRIDLAGVGFVDRAGIEALQRLSRAGAEICCRSGPVASVLEGERISVVSSDAGEPEEDRTDER
jgi:ABC-type transporter Mla MlaB component